MTDGKPELTAKQIAARFAAMERREPVAEVELDDATRENLERWFGLPSFQQVAEQPSKDPDMDAARERRDAAIAAVDPALLAELEERAASTPFQPAIDVRIDPDLVREPFVAPAREPRERELPVEIEDDLQACTPQALLRDLHRAELAFDKTFELVDAAADERVDASALVAEAMRTPIKLPPLAASPLAEARALLAEVRAERRASWPALFARQPLPNRRVP